MATYHGIEQAMCCECGTVITDTFTLEVINDGPEGCPLCLSDDKHFIWRINDGTIIYTLDKGDLVRYEMLAPIEMQAVWPNG